MLIKRVLQSWGIARSGARIDRRFEELLEGMKVVRVEHRENDFFWPAGADPSAYERYRPGYQDSSRRNADELPPEEVSAAIRAQLAVHISLQRADLIRETVRAFGYQRSGAALEKAMLAGLELAVARGAATVDDQDRVIGEM